MAQIDTIRGWHFNQMENNIKSVTSIISITDPQALTTFRDGGTGWTVLEVLGHLRDFEQVFMERARLTVEQENPPLPFPNPDALAAENSYNEQNPDEVLVGWKANRTALVAYLRERAESDWTRIAAHPVRGELTLLDQFYLMPTHDSIHLEQMTRILSEKK